MFFAEAIALALILVVVGLKAYSLHAQNQRIANPPPEIMMEEEVDNVPGQTDSSAMNLVRPLDWGEIFLLVIGLTMCPPLGLVLLWKTDKLTARSKNFILIGYVMLVTLFLLGRLAFS